MARGLDKLEKDGRARSCLMIPASSWGTCSRESNMPAGSKETRCGLAAGSQESLALAGAVLAESARVQRLHDHEDLWLCGPDS